MVVRKEGAYNLYYMMKNVESLIEKTLGKTEESLTGREEWES